jgi:PAS domain S-box-containing protein
MEKKQITTFRQSVLYGNVQGQKRADRDQTYVINVYSLITLVSAVTFGALHILVENNTTVGQLELICSFVILINMLAFRLVHSITLARTVLLLSIMALMLILLISGGTQNTGIFWLFVFPIVTFFLVGKKQGVWWVVGLYALIGLVAGAAYFSLIDIPYSLITIRQLFVSLTVVGIGVYIYQGARDAALKEVDDSRRELQEYLDQMTTYSIKVGIDGRILLANKAAKEASGLGERLLGSKFLGNDTWLLNEAAHKRAEEAFYRVLTGKPVAYDEQIKVSSTEGYHFPIVNISMLPILENGRIKYVLFEARDVSAEHEANRSKSEFVALASHQLQPSISAISLSTETLRRGALLDEQRQNVQQIDQNNQRIRAIINNILFVSSLELGNLPVKPSATDISILARDIVKEMQTNLLANDRQLEISEDYADNLPAIPVDPELMQTILRNLISNAIKFTPDGGRVNVRISQTEQKIIDNSKGGIQIEIQDSGHGIPASEQKMLFTKFFRATNVDKKYADSSGLGLYIVKKLLDYVDGHISYTSKENVGTIFIVILPLEGMAEHSAS